MERWWARGSSVDGSHLEPVSADEMLNWIKGQDGGRCLDIGAGSGFHRSMVEARGLEWVGVDPFTSSFLSVVCDGHALPFKDGCFRACIAMQVMEHLRDPHEALREINRVLEKGGKFVGSVSFLEPYHHESYFHFSPLGLKHILNQCGFDDRVLAPGEDGLFMVERGLLGPAFVPFVARSKGRALRMVRDKVGPRMMRRQTGSKEPVTDQSLQADRMKLAGHLVFYAQKR